MGQQSATVSAYIDAVHSLHAFADLQNLHVTLHSLFELTVTATDVVTILASVKLVRLALSLQYLADDTTEDMVVVLYAASTLQLRVFFKAKRR